MRPLRSIRNRLALIFFAITLTAIGGIYVGVIPSLRSSLRDEKLDTLTTAANRYSGPIRRVSLTYDPTIGYRALRQAADRSNSQVTLVEVRNRQTARVVADTSAAAGFEDLNFRVAIDAARIGAVATGFASTSDGEVGQAARPLARRGTRIQVAVYSSRLADIEGNVAVIRRRILVAGGSALVFAVLAGYLVAGRLARRMRRLERGAEKVASGDFSEEIMVDSDDELGQLARAFNDMQAQLEQLDSARKQFIATASHELRTPIFSLGGFAELLEDEDVDQETHRVFVRQIREQIERLTKLTTELLDLSKLEAGSLELRPEPTDIAHLARDVSHEFTPALTRHDSHLELRLAGSEIEAVCDPERVAQIMRILIDNALAHTPAGTNIFVSAARSNGTVRLAVRDEGPGIKPEAVNLIFEPFYTSNDTRGSGLGLAIAGELAERMRGQLLVDSQPGRTIFTLVLPT